MTSEDALKTNEFIRRRKLRLQQVREQSKDIAKKIRQRAKVEKIKQVVELDAKKQKEYFQRQEALVNKLEEFYAKGIQNVGASHKHASEVNLQENRTEKVDPSKQRGKEAAAELRRKRQEKLDEQKKVLDRRLQAREAANEVSRDKSAAVLQKISIKASGADAKNKDGDPDICDRDDNNAGEGSEVKRDMATQWDLEPNELEHNIPKLALPKDDKDSVKETNNNSENKSEKSKQLDLFALSEEMPSSLRGGLTTRETVPVKPSMTLVSEYLQNRGLRLRESDSISSKKNTDELRSLKQTIFNTRASKEGTCLCQVHDEELIPVPTWRAEKNCVFCSPSPSEHRLTRPKNCGSMYINNVFGAATPMQPEILPSPVLRTNTPFRRNKICLRSSKETNNNVPSKTCIVSNVLPKKNLVTVYNHSTRNVKDIPYNDERLVVRDLQDDEDDAYSQAMRESSTNNNIQKNQVKKIQEIRSKVAVTKQNVEKEYRDTMSFLNSLPKNTGDKPIRRAYMDEDRQQSIKDNRQRKLQQEYRKIIKECKKHSCQNKSRSRSRSPSNNFDSTDFQYSWMPVPESDGNLAIHTIPTSLKEGKSGNTVKFSKVDSYHEYRSRHKHTPPTKETTTSRKPKRGKVTEAVLMQDSSDSESVPSETSSTDNIMLQKKENTVNTEKLSDAERIIIYKILDSKKEKDRNSKIIKDIAKSLTLIEKQTASNEKESHRKKTKSKKFNKESDNRIELEELEEGIYEAVNNNGDNITSMYFDKTKRTIELTEDDIKYGRPCTCGKTSSKDQNGKGIPVQWESGDKPPLLSRCSKSCTGCKCGCVSTKPKENPESAVQPSAATSTSSFKSAVTSEKANIALPDGGVIKLIDESGEEAGKFYIGASGFLKDDAYEVVIQLRKKGDEKEKETTKLAQINEEEPVINKVSEESTEVSPIESLQEIDTTKSLSKRIDSQAKELINPNVKDTIDAVSEIQTNINTEGSSSQPNIDINPPINIQKEEKAISTSFEDVYAIPTHIPKTDSNLKAATSTYTQTSLFSPNQRPVLLHMSSSTSTAYMSPPEMILPKFLKQGYRISDDELLDPRNFNMVDKVEVSDIRAYSEDYLCGCRKCRHIRKATLSRSNTSHRCTKVNHRLGNSKSPTNNAGRDRDESNDAEPTASEGKKTCICRKCQSLNRQNKQSSSNNNEYTNIPIASKRKYSSQNHVRVTSSSASTNKQGKLRRSNINLNPIIREYINKLLALNKESLKAVQVVEQDCSSVATPSSSIINDRTNKDGNKPAVDNQISLEQIKNIVKQQLLNECKKKSHHSYTNRSDDECLRNHHKTKIPKVTRKKPIHKVKSLNISKNLVKIKKSANNKLPQPSHSLSSSSSKGRFIKPFPSENNGIRSKSSPTPRTEPPPDVECCKISTDIAATHITKQNNEGKKISENKIILNPNSKQKKMEHRSIDYSSLSFNPTTTASVSPNSETSAPRHKGNQETPSNMSTQTSINVDSEINYLRFDEDKIQNMERIADLTEKCTKRLSSLAKVLEEVRKNKSLAYSQISASDTNSDSDQKSERDANNMPANVHQLHEKQKSKSPEILTAGEDFNANNYNPTNYIPFLNDIPKPDPFRTPNIEINSNIDLSNKSNSSTPVNEITELNLKSRGKPPPALSRIHLKHVQDYVIPHELSTVVEVDSPMSVKLKNQTSRHETKLESPDSLNFVGNASNKASNLSEERNNENPDLLTSNTGITLKTKMPSESSDDSKLQMIDMNQFNEIMLKPFFSLQEYAKQNNIGNLNDGSNLEDFVRGDLLNDEMSSLHSDGSLPDVISELLKRNIISEPFKFDTGSNVNSTTVSSESTLSVLALSKARKEKKKSCGMFQNKENIEETSDTMSMSSNPDLENAFKRLGMGWASSTLKKTKERLALSSSSNTSSSSLTQFKIKKQDTPVLLNDTVSSVMNQANKVQAADVSKNAEQQTSLTNSMTVKEFLTKELANKITFNKSRNDTDAEFVSLFETKMPEEMKQTSRLVREDSIDNSMRSTNNNRARTSTPVQLFKSMTYQSSSSSNLSNGLFSNADDLSSVKGNSNSMKHSSTDKDDLTIPNCSLRIKKGPSECSKSD